MDFKAEAQAIGIKEICYSSERDGTIDDVELAHEMALAMCDEMEYVVRYKRFGDDLADSEPKTTFRRAGKKGELFSQIVEEIKTVEDERLPTYKTPLTTDQFVDKENVLYQKRTSEEERIDAQRKKNQHTGDTDAKQTPFKADPITKRITHGFVGDLAKRASEQRQKAANNAGNLIFFKHRLQDNIEVFAKTLNASDQETFKPLNTRRSSEVSRAWFKDDAEAIELNARYQELWETFFKKLHFQKMAEALGVENVDDLDRDAVVELSKMTRTPSFARFVAS